VLREPLGQEIRDALSDDARLARAGTREDEQGSVDMEDGLALFGIEGL